MKLFIKKLAFAFMCATVITATIPVAVYCGPQTAASSSAGGSASLDEVTTKVTTTISDTQTKIVSVALAAAPLALIVALLGLMITHNDRKIAGLLSFCGIILAASAAIILVNGGTAMNIIHGLFDNW